MRRGLIALFVAQAVSLVGSRLSMVALPWFTFVTTGSAAKTGLVAFAEMAPYVVACAAGGPALDRLGVRRASVLADLLSAGAVAAIAGLHLTGALGYPALLALVAAAGLLRGFGDTAKRVLLPQVVAAAGADLTRAAAVHDGISRLSTMLGAPLAGILIAVLGAAPVLLLDAATFAVAAAVIALVRSGPAPMEPAEREPYLRSLRSGIAFLWRHPLLRAIALLVCTTNLFDQAYAAVLAPVWAREVVGSPVALGLAAGALGAGAVLGNLAFTAVATRLPRRATFAVGFLVGGAPRFFATAYADDLWIVYAVAFTGGVAIAAVNPILTAVQFECVPPGLRSRVLGLSVALAWASIPVGGLLGGTLVSALGLTAALLCCGVGYLLVTLLPFVVPVWRGLDRGATTGQRHEDTEQEERDGGDREDHQEVPASTRGVGGGLGRRGR